MKSEMELEREQAWVGDAVLSLFTRRWILAHQGAMNGEMLARFTSNQFLLAVGNPTSVEARIGRLYEAEGWTAAETWIEEELVPRWRKRLSKEAAARRPRGESKKMR